MYTGIQQNLHISYLTSVLSVSLPHGRSCARKHLTARLISLPLLLMVLHSDDHHWFPVFIVCWLSSHWLARPCQATGQCLLLLSAWGSPSCPRTEPSHSNWNKVQRMPVSSWCSAASSCGCTQKLVRNCKWVTDLLFYLFMYLFTFTPPREDYSSVSKQVNSAFCSILVRTSVGVRDKKVK